MSAAVERLRRFLPVLWAGSAAWALVLLPAAWASGRPLAWVLAVGAWLLLLAAGCVERRRLAVVLGLYGFLGAAAALLSLWPRSPGGPIGRAVFLLAWVAYALSWGALAARDMPLLADSSERPRLPPRRGASRWAILAPLLGGGLGFALLVPAGPDLARLEGRPEVALLVQLLGVVLALGLVGRATAWGVAQHFPAPLSVRQRLGRALGPLLLLAAALGVGGWWLL